MTEIEKEKGEAVAAVSAGAGVGGVGGTTVGVLELAAQGSVTAWSASVVDRLALWVAKSHRPAFSTSSVEPSQG